MVFGHSFHEYPSEKYGTDLLVYRMMYSFRMPLFMFVSGYLMVFTTMMRPGPGKSVSEFTKGKIKRLLLPFFVLSLVTFVPRSLMGNMADEPLSLSWSSLVESLLIHDKLVISFFWFLQASFMLLVFNYSLLKLGRKARLDDHALYTIIVAFFIVLPYFFPYDALGNYFSLERAVTFGLFFVCGAAYCRFSEFFDYYIPWTSFIFLGVTASAWAVLFFLTENTDYSRICSLAGILMCVSLARILVKYDIRFLDHLIGANYMIFLLSWYCNVASQQVLHHFVELPWWCYTILSLVSGIYIPWLGYRYLQSHPQSRWVRITALLLGQSFKKK